MNTTIEIYCVVTREVTVTICATDELVQVSTKDGAVVIGWDDIPSLLKAIRVIQKKRIASLVKEKKL